MMLVAMLLPACASLTVVDTTPLPASKLEPPGSETISAGGYRIDSVTSLRQIPDLLILVAMSGGGKRSAAYAYGALKGMGQVTVPGDGRSLLSQLDGISGISGGSFTAAYYGLHRDKMFGQYEKDFLYSDTNAYIFGIYLLPWNWGWIADPTVGTNDYMERVYDRTMFHGAKYKDLSGLTPASLVVSRVVSKPLPDRLTTDLGHKAIAADPPAGKRAVLLNLADYTPILQNEEHFAIDTPRAGDWKIGDVIYAVPTHVCPTVALHRRACVVENNRFIGTWEIASRDRKLTV